MLAVSDQLMGTTSPSRVRRWPLGFRIYALIHGVWIALYALLGKGFAYAGFAPFFAGEFLLMLALVAIVASRRLGSLLAHPLGVVFAAFLIWQISCAAPHYGIFGFDTLRDSVIWAYAVFAFAAAALILRLPGLLRAIVSTFAKSARWFLFLGPTMWLVTSYLRADLPTWPDTTVSIPLIKGDEYCVHLAGVLALSLQGIGPVRNAWVILILADAMIAMNVRSGLLAFVVAASFAICLRPKPERILVVGACCATLITAMAATDFRMTLPGTAREFSLEQLNDSLLSVVGNSSRSDLESTRRWRLIWWQEIVDYTFDGQYFWTGKGYGVNLADSDGFQVGSRDEPLRSPHNSHLTILARSGVPGLFFWVLLQAMWAILVFKSYLQARRRRANLWVGIFAWLLAYWLAFMTAAGFDVFLEGPMAGIPFWTLFGVGWGAHILFQSQLDPRRNGRQVSAEISPEGIYANA